MPPTYKMPLWLMIAINDLGECERPGVEFNNPRIQEYLRATGIEGPDEIPHCAAAVNCWLKEGGMAMSKEVTTRDGSKLPPAAARSFCEYGEEIHRSEIKRGDIIVVPRGNDPRKGHVLLMADYYDEDDSFIYCISANRNNRVSLSVLRLGRALSIRRPVERVNYKKGE